MPRPIGSRVMTCAKCGGKVVGMPGQVRKCSYCDCKVRITKKPVEKKKPAKKSFIKVVTLGKKSNAKPVKKVTKKRANNTQPSAMA